MVCHGIYILVSKLPKKKMSYFRLVYFNLGSVLTAIQLAILGKDELSRNFPARFCEVRTSVSGSECCPTLPRVKAKPLLGHLLYIVDGYVNF